MSCADSSLGGVLVKNKNRPPSQRSSPQIKPANKRIHRVMPNHAPSIIGHPKPPQQFIIALISFLFCLARISATSGEMLLLFSLSILSRMEQEERYTWLADKFKAPRHMSVDARGQSP